MYRLNNIKQNILIVSFATLLAGCSGGGTTTSSDSTTSTDSTTSADSTTSTTSTLKVVTVQTNEPLITETSATINWIPNDYITKLVEYGTSRKYGSEVLVQEEGTVTLDNLQPNTLYHYRIVAEDTNGKRVVSRDKTFTTLEQSTQPIVTEPVPSEPIVTEPIPSEPIVTEPAPTEPIVTEPAPTEPIATEPTPTEPTPEPTPVCKSGPAMQHGQVKDSISDIGLANVTVTIDGCITQTDAQGFYELNNIAVSDRAVVTFKYDGYYMNSEIIAIKEYSDGTTLSPNYLEFALDKYDAKNTADSQNEKWWRYNFGIKIAGGIYTDSEGNDYSGNATAQVAYEDVSTEKGRDVFPGAYEGINSNGVTVPFISYGFMVIDLSDDSGKELSISGDIILTFHTAVGATADIIPLWYYDYAQGVWIEEGYATRLADGKYEGTVSHPGTWSLSKPVEDAVGIYTDRILYPDGTPVQNLQIHAIGEKWIRSDLSTDENGVFEVEVIPGKTFTLKAYHSTDKYSATYNGTIAGIASGEIVNNSKL